jgi:hypothetical protein
MAGFRLVASLMNDRCSAGNGWSAAALRHVAAGHKRILRADYLAGWFSAVAAIDHHPSISGQWPLYGKSACGSREPKGDL